MAFVDLGDDLGGQESCRWFDEILLMELNMREEYFFFNEHHEF